MITLTFNKSRSPKYPEAVKLALEFDRAVNAEPTFAEISVKEIFEKWDTFNQLFWTVVDWKGMTLSYDGMEYHSHTDKTRIFYSLQNARWKWLAFVESRLTKLDEVYAGKIDLKNLSTESMTEEEINNLLDGLNSGKKQTN